jgi:hypothetical protein
MSKVTQRARARPPLTPRPPPPLTPPPAADTPCRPPKHTPPPNNPSYPPTPPYSTQQPHIPPTPPPLPPTINSPLSPTPTHGRTPPEQDTHIIHGRRGIGWGMGGGVPPGPWGGRIPLEIPPPLGGRPHHKCD